MTLVDFWFFLIAVLWIGYFFLEGFDFGVGMLLPILARNERERRVMINTIGPVWDGNEVWLLTAGGATFAAFPIWYATLFSGFYLPLLLILVALIVRTVAFEYRGKASTARGPAANRSWRARWDACIIFGSYVPAILWGVAFANIVRGVPLNARHDYVGGFFNLLNPYALLGGITLAAVFLTHGAMFIALKTRGEIKFRAEEYAWRIGVVTVVLAVAFIVWTQIAYGSSFSLIFFAIAALALLGALGASKLGRDGWSFAGMGVTIAFFVLALFSTLYPNVMPATDPANTLSAATAASSTYSLEVMTWVAVCVTPLVIAYQAWSYWVFSKRISIKSIPVDAAAGTDRTGLVDKQSARA